MPWLAPETTASNTPCGQRVRRKRGRRAAHLAQQLGQGRGVGAEELRQRHVALDRDLLGRSAQSAELLGDRRHHAVRPDAVEPRPDQQLGKQGGRARRGHACQAQESEPRSGDDAELEHMRAGVSCAVLLERLPPPWQLDTRESTRRGIVTLTCTGGCGGIGREWWDEAAA